MGGLCIASACPALGEVQRQSTPNEHFCSQDLTHPRPKPGGIFNVLFYELTIPLIARQHCRLT